MRAVNNENKTPLHLSTEREYTYISDILTSNGADVSIRYQYKKELESKGKKFHNIEDENVSFLYFSRQNL